jgi:hypothetical protein
MNTLFSGMWFRRAAKLSIFRARLIVLYSLMTCEFAETAQVEAPARTTVAVRTGVVAVS